MKRLITTLVLLFVLLNGISQIVLPTKWQFTTGDNLDWASHSFDDSQWREVVPGTVWEQQGLPGYDGYAWYRVSVIIPSKVKKDALEYGGLTLDLGKIDDADYTYFNGELIGKMGEFPPNYICKYDEPRKYTIPVSLVKWDQTNSIAVRVFDNGGNGGIYSEPIQLSVLGLADKIVIEPLFESPDRVFKGSNSIKLKYNLSNNSKKAFSGKLELKVVSDFKEDIFFLEREVALKSNKKTSSNFLIPNVAPGFYRVSLTFVADGITKSETFMIGYEPEKIVSLPNPQIDFENYWSRAKKELAAVDPQYKLTRIDSLCTSKRNIFLVEMRSLGNILIRGWYSVPTAPGKYPVVMQVPGYSSTINPHYIDYGDDLIGFGLNIRGHGNSKDSFNPGFPGYLQHFLNDRELYAYRGAYMDCVRGIDFLFTRPEVDTARVAVEGASQGGALTFAAAALDNKRVKVCVPQVPFLSDFEDYFKVAGWPGNEFMNYVEVEHQQTWEEVYKTLSYIDIKNLASWIKAPLLMGVGLVDDVCPPHINFAAYNQVTSQKAYIVYPTSGHSLPQDFHNQKMKWIRDKLGVNQQ